MSGAGRVSTIGVSTGAVTRDNVDTGTAVQPSSDRLRVTVRQNIDGAALQIDDERAVAPSSALRA